AVGRTARRDPRRSLRSNIPVAACRSHHVLAVRHSRPDLEGRNTPSGAQSACDPRPGHGRTGTEAIPSQRRRRTIGCRHARVSWSSPYSPTFQVSAGDEAGVGALSQHSATAAQVRLQNIRLLPVRHAHGGRKSPAWHFDRENRPLGSGTSSFSRDAIFWTSPVGRCTYLVRHLIIVTARAVQQTTRQMRHELSNGGVRPPNMNPLVEPEDPDCRVHAAWLGQVSKAGDRLLAKEAGGSTRVSASASAPADRLAGQEVRLAPAHVDRRSGLILMGCIFAAAIAAVITIPSYLSFFETWQQPTGDPI